MKNSNKSLEQRIEESVAQGVREHIAILEKSGRGSGASRSTASARRNVGHAARAEKNDAQRAGAEASTALNGGVGGAGRAAARSDLRAAWRKNDGVRKGG